ITSKEWLARNLHTSPTGCCRQVRCASGWSIVIVRASPQTADRSDGTKRGIGRQSLSQLPGLDWRLLFERSSALSAAAITARREGTCVRGNPARSVSCTAATLARLG